MTLLRLVLATGLVACAGILDAAEPLLAGKTADQWQQGLSDRDPQVRRQAAATLANLAPQAAVGGLRSDDEVVRYWAALGLANRANGKLLEPLLQDKSPTVRGVAAYGVAQAGDVEQALPVLLALLDDPQPAVATQAMTWLDQLGDVAKPHRAKFEALAAGESEYPKRLALRMLARWQK